MALTRRLRRYAGFSLTANPGVAPHAFAATRGNVLMKRRPARAPDRQHYPVWRAVLLIFHPCWQPRRLAAAGRNDTSPSI